MSTTKELINLFLNKYFTEGTSFRDKVSLKDLHEVFEDWIEKLTYKIKKNDFSKIMKELNHKIHLRKNYIYYKLTSKKMIEKITDEEIEKFKTLIDLKPIKISKSSGLSRTEKSIQYQFNLFSGNRVSKSRKRTPKPIPIPYKESDDPIDIYEYSCEKHFIK